jgi:hypothetical protein
VSASCQAAADHAADSTVIHHLLKEYTPVVDTVDLKPLAQFWSDPPPTFRSSIYSAKKHGFDVIEWHVFEKVLGGMFSARDVNMHDVAIYVNGNSAWSAFR